MQAWTGGDRSNPPPCTENSELLNANWRIVTARKRQMQLMPAINQLSSNMALRSRSRIVRWRNVWWNWRSLGETKRDRRRRCKTSINQLGCSSIATTVCYHRQETLPSAYVACR